MKQIQFLDWAFEADTELTSSIYSAVAKGSSEKCQCSLCQNYLVNRRTLYPRSVSELFTSLGIDIDKDYEVIHYGRETDTLHLYANWFNFVGQIVSGPTCKVNLANGGISIEHLDLSDTFSIAFIQANKPPVESYFDKVDTPVIEINLLFKIPWVIGGVEPE